LFLIAFSSFKTLIVGVHPVKAATGAMLLSIFSYFEVHTVDAARGTNNRVHGMRFKAAVDQ
jgi:hypothetical protein